MRAGCCRCRRGSGTEPSAVCPYQILLRAVACACSRTPRSRWCRRRRLPVRRAQHGRVLSGRSGTADGSGMKPRCWPPTTSHALIAASPTRLLLRGGERHAAEVALQDDLRIQLVGDERVQLNAGRADQDSRRSRRVLLRDLVALPAAGRAAVPVGVLRVLAVVGARRGPSSSGPARGGCARAKSFQSAVLMRAVRVHRERAVAVRCGRCRSCRRRRALGPARRRAAALPISGR